MAPSRHFYDRDERAVMARKPKGSEVWERRRAVRVVATLARDAGDAAQLLGALGLDPEEGRP